MNYAISAKTVSLSDEAIRHINHYNTGHLEAIINAAGWVWIRKRRFRGWRRILYWQENPFRN